MKNLLYILISLWFVSCQYGEPKLVDKPIDLTELHLVGQKVTPDNSQGYKLMQQYCFACHAEKPGKNFNKKMIAPPIVRVREHYLPVYPNKADFVKAIVSWVNKPEKSKLQMPGATRKFGLMPPLPIGDDKLTAIATYLYQMDLEKISHKKMGVMHGSLHLNKGKKWKIDKKDTERVALIVSKLNRFKSNKVSDYQHLGSEIFDSAKQLILNKNYKGATFDQIHLFFGAIEDDLHNLMGVKTIENGNKYLKKLKIKFHKFSSFFE